MIVDTKRYNDLRTFMTEQFPFKVQKLSLHAGFTCPNRDGTKGFGGCSYCNNNSFNPAYCKTDNDISRQLESGIDFFSRKYKELKYLAYFQAYTNTYGKLEEIKNLYRIALNHPEVVGLVIGTRPDCIQTELVDFLSDLAKEHFISVEIGIESTNNKTLERVNRCHTYEETICAFNTLKNSGIHLGGHLIIGLPGESKEDILAHADRISELPIHSIKLHHLQIVKHTKLAKEYANDPGCFQLLDLDDYLELISEFVTRLRPDIIIERFVGQTPPHLLVAPKWGQKNYEIASKINHILEQRNQKQGCNYIAISH